jgi:hypothetical protein
MAPFRIGINMAGAISAGVYTAGVLDLVIEALDQWHEAKALNSRRVVIAKLGESDPLPDGSNIYEPITSRIVPRTL